MLRYQDFLNKAVDESIKGAVRDYGDRSDSVGKCKLKGAVAGLNACRDLSPPQLAKLLVRVGEIREKAHRQHTNSERYWQIRCFENEVNWICNVISCVLVNEGMPPIIEPTVRAAQLAANISKDLTDNLN